MQARSPRKNVCVGACARARIAKQALSSNENTKEDSSRVITILTANTKQKIVQNATMGFCVKLRIGAYTSVQTKAAISTPKFVHVAKMAI